MYYGNLPPGVTPRMIDGDPDRVSYTEQTRQWFVDHREVPCDAPTEDYVWNRIARDDEPGPDEVLRWIEKQVVAGNLDPVDDAVPYAPRDRTQVPIPPGILHPYSGCPGCGNHPCTCRPPF